MFQKTQAWLASTYDCGAYGAGGFENEPCTTASTSPLETALDSALAYTGTPMFVTVALAVVIIVAAAVFILRRRK